MFIIEIEEYITVSFVLVKEGALTDLACTKSSSTCFYQNLHGFRYLDGRTNTIFTRSFSLYERCFTKMYT